MSGYALIFTVAAIVAAASTPIVARLARLMRIVDRPGTRKVHSKATPSTGGTVIVVGTLAALAASPALGESLAEAFRAVRVPMLALLATGAFMFVVGLVDDSMRVPARLKLGAQVLAAGVVCAAGVRIEVVDVPAVGALELGLWSWPVTMFWIVAITNTVNLIDGLDGLAAGISAVACGVTVVVCLHTGQLALAAVMLAMMGALAGFLFHNFHPARIFLGDCGSMVLGFCLATASVMCAGGGARFVGLALPALALALPIFDTLFSIVRRTLQRRSLLAPDRDHLHHRLIGLGLPHRRAVVIMYAVTLISAGLGMFMLLTRGAARLVVFVGALVPSLALFRAAGAVRLKEAVGAFRRNRAIAREARQRRRGFEEMQLRLRDATDVSHWWRAVRRAAREMKFAAVVIEYDDGGPPSQLTWRMPGKTAGPLGTVHATIRLPVGHDGRTLRVGVDVPLNGSLESAGRRLALFGRLLDEHGLGSLPGATAAGAAEPSAAAAAAERAAGGVEIGLWVPDRSGAAEKGHAPRGEAT
jgi:UDP-GlcNAc:undecaprenyl-phosphate GlcNAc-1-phosphate transferase